MYQTIKYEVKENIGYVTINRPEALNALNKTVLEELLDVFTKIGTDEEVKAAVEKHKEYIMKETLAVSLEFAEAADKYDLNGHKTG